MPLGSVRVARLREEWLGEERPARGSVGSPDGPVHNFINVTGWRACTQIPSSGTSNLP